MRSQVCLGFVIFVVPMFVCAQAPIQLSGDDVVFQFAGLAKTSLSTGTRVQSVNRPSANRLCGFSINGNHRSRTNPHVEWDFNIDEIVTPDRAIAGLSAGTFDVVDHKRRPRPPITQLRFALEGVTDPIVATIHGRPNSDNAIVAMIEPEPASRLFLEFQSMRPIVISMQYSDGSADAVQVRGIRDNRKFGGGKNSYFNECLRGFRVPLGGETRVPRP